MSDTAIDTGSPALRLPEALAAATRSGAQPDPIAQALLASRDLPMLMARLAVAGCTRFSPLATGASSIVLASGDRAVRLGRGPLAQRVAPAPMLAVLAAGTVGELRYEITERVDTASITAADVEAMSASLAAQDLALNDAGPGQLARRADGTLVVFDPDALAVR